MRSFRTRLAILFSLVFVGVLIISTLLSSIIFQKLLIESVDHQLMIPIDRLHRALHPRMDFDRVQMNLKEVHGDEIKADKLRILVFDHHTDGMLYPESNTWWQELDASLWAFDPEEELHHLDHKPHEKGKGKGKGKGGVHPGHAEAAIPKVVFSNITMGGKEWRVGTQSQKGYTVLMASDLADYQAEFSTLFKWLLLLGPVGLLLVGFGGWYVADRAMKPLTTITETASHIEVSDLKERLPVVADDYGEIADLTLVFNRMMDRLEKGFVNEKRFSDDVSHELKTPIAIMQAELDSGLKQVLPDSDEALRLHSISKETHRLKSIINSLMMLSRAESGQLKANLTEISFSEEVEDLVEDAEILCQKQQLELHSKIESDIIVDVDPVLFHQTLLNLLSNAIKFNEPNGWIEIRLCKDNTAKQAIFSISNSGVGIPEDDVEHIFKRFYRVDKARNRSIDGFGLGLSLCKEIMTLLGGELVLVETSDKVTTFQIVLTLASRSTD